MTQYLTLISVSLLLTSVRAAAPYDLTIRIIDGEGAAYSAGSRATRGITVEVTDSSGRPVDGAIVSFILPKDGPSGVFMSGSRTEVVSTKHDGHAGVWGMQWNRNPGSLEVHIAATKGSLHGAADCTQVLTTAVAGENGIRSSSGSHKLLWISLALGGAAAAGLAGMSGGKGSSSSSSSTTSSSNSPSTVQIGTPTISLGHP